MKNINVYEECPTYNGDIITLRITNENDAKELLKCYSDKKAVLLFNSDNCHGDDFYYDTIEKMNNAINFWKESYKNKYFVRFTIILNRTNEKIGTIEIFKRSAEDEFDGYGVLRVDLQSKYEVQEVIDDILKITNEFFYNAFDVTSILTKAIPEAKERIISLTKNGYEPINKKFMIYDDYYCRTI